MSLPATEALHQDCTIDSLPSLQAAEFALMAQQTALSAVHRALPQITAAADVMADAVHAQKKLHYCAAGSSGLMALADCCELPGTFGISSDAIRFHMAGGVPSDGDMPGFTEDDAKAGEDVGNAVDFGDAFLVLSASGTTPYAISAAKAAKENGAKVIALANNPDTPLLECGDVSICLPTPPEIVAGSTRLGAGTAQKTALNIMSTLMGVRLGHVYQGMMVNVVADNAKLKNRAAKMVSHISNVSEQMAYATLETTKGLVKPAILVVAGQSIEQAEILLAKHLGHLKPCFEDIKN
ncbi:MAG: N-acetylmuramic acid 6-phosphate etherase [Paracoccaceae bacterium]